jgi:hypothetical protein
MLFIQIKRASIFNKVYFIIFIYITYKARFLQLAHAHTNTPKKHLYYYINTVVVVLLKWKKTNVRFY